MAPQLPNPDSPVTIPQLTPPASLDVETERLNMSQANDSEAEPPVRDVRPRLSVVLPASGDGAGLQAALAVLAPQCREQSIDLLVVGSETWPELTRITSRHPGVRVVTAAAGASSEELRSLGLARVTAPIVIFTDEDRATRTAWSEVLLQCSGTLRPGIVPDQMTDWAAWLTRAGVTNPTGG